MATGLTLKQIIGIVLAIVVVISTFNLFSGLLGWFSGPPDEGTKVTYEKMFAAINALYDPKTKITECFLAHGYIEPDYAIVGFPKSGGVEESCGAIDDDVNRPRKCGMNSCLCVCNGGYGDIEDDDCAQSTSTCKQLSAKVTDLETKYDGEMVDMVLYGESCITGSDSKVIVGFKITKNNGKIEIYEVKNKKDFENKAWYPKGKPISCDVLVNDLKKKKTKAATAAKAATKTTSPQGGSVTEQVEQTKLEVRT